MGKAALPGRAREAHLDCLDDAGVPSEVTSSGSVRPRPFMASKNAVTVSSGAGRGGGRNAARDFHGEKRTNATHSSTTDPDARLFRKSAGKEAKLAHMGT